MNATGDFFNMKRALFLFVVLAIVFTSSELLAETDPAAKAKPKNIIIMIGDGMGYNTVYNASLYYTGRMDGFSWQGLSYTASISTYAIGGSYDPLLMWLDSSYCASGATDSAAAATALSCGIKTYNGAIGVNSQHQPVENIMERAKALGMSTGVVTSVPFSHATPAGFVAHNESRGNYADIALKMLESDVDVIMGAGHPYYDNDGKRQNRAISYNYVGGESGWSGLRNGDYGKFISKRKGFRKYREGKTPDRLIGVVQVHQTLQQRRSSVVNAGPAAEKKPFQTPMNKNVPTLEEMAAAALNVLDNNEMGFVLMVEGGAIDWAGHANQTARSIEETLQFNDAIEAVLDWVEKKSTWDETLLIITADHETGYMFAEGASSSEVVPGSKDGKIMPGVEWKSSGHTNQLVPFFVEGVAAKGLIKRTKMKDAVRGKYMDNTEIARYLLRLLR